MLTYKTKTADDGRLKHNPHEQEALRLLYEQKVGMGSLRDTILCNILHCSFRQDELSPKEKLLQDLVIENQELTEMIVDTLFQWFGTSVGSNVMEKFLGDVKKTPDQTPEEKLIFGTLQRQWDEEEEKLKEEAETIRIENKGF